MAIQSTQSNHSTFNLRYSAFLGMLYVSNPNTEALIKSAKAQVGEAEVKKGYQGNSGDTSSAIAITQLKTQGITPQEVTGILTSARIVERTIDGRLTPYLNVSLKENEERYYLSVDLTQSAAQMLVRKLVNAEIGVFTKVNLFASFGKKPGAARAYADHGASLTQHGVEVKSVNPMDELVPRVEAALEKLREAGISDDKETLAKRRSKIELEFHCELMKTVTEKVNAYYAQTELPEESEAAM